jgi:hypothetical protein
MKMPENIDGQGCLLVNLSIDSLKRVKLTLADLILRRREAPSRRMEADTIALAAVLGDAHFVRSSGRGEG